MTAHPEAESDAVWVLVRMLMGAEDDGVIAGRSWPEDASRVGGPYVAEIVMASGPRYRVSIERIEERES